MGGQSAEDRQADVCRAPAPEPGLEGAQCRVWSRDRTVSFLCVSNPQELRLNARVR